MLVYGPVTPPQLCFARTYPFVLGRQDAERGLDICAGQAVGDAWWLLGEPHRLVLHGCRRGRGVFCSSMGEQALLRALFRVILPQLQSRLGCWV